MGSLVKYSLSKSRTGMLTYRYAPSRDLGFEFHTLAEVGEPYQQWFRDEIALRGYVVDYGVDLPTAPWVADLVVGVYLG